MKRDIENILNDFGDKFVNQVINLLYFMMRKHRLFRIEKPSVAYFGSLEQAGPTSSIQYAKSHVLVINGTIHMTSEENHEICQGNHDLTFQKTPLSLQLW